MPIVFGALLGFMLGGLIGNATFGPHGGLAGCIIGLLVGTAIMATLRSSWARQEVSGPPTVEETDDIEDELEEDQKV
jgi:predicted lipid-binding transport protein (Tim44 family)